MAGAAEGRAIEDAQVKVPAYTPQQHPTHPCRRVDIHTLVKNLLQGLLIARPGCAKESPHLDTLF